MLIAGGNARPFEICRLDFAFCPAEAESLPNFSKGLTVTILSVRRVTFCGIFGIDSSRLFLNCFCSENGHCLTTLDETHNAEVRWG
jgi:hypothetical protein